MGSSPRSHYIWLLVFTQVPFDVDSSQASSLITVHNGKSGILLCLICRGAPGWQIANIRKFPSNTALLCLKTVLKVVFLNGFYVQIWIRAFKEIVLICGCGSFKYAYHNKDWVRKSQIRKVSRLGKIHMTNYLSLQICGFAICGNYLRTAQCPPLFDSTSLWMDQLG
jgi:hypothetical protein